MKRIKLLLAITFIILKISILHAKSNDEGLSINTNATTAKVTETTVSITSKSNSTRNTQVSPNIIPLNGNNLHSKRMNTIHKVSAKYSSRMSFFKSRTPLLKMNAGNDATFHEGFESYNGVTNNWLPSNWTELNKTTTTYVTGDSINPTWAVNPANSYTSPPVGKSMAWVDWDSKSSRPQDVWLVSPAFTPVTGDTVTFDFFYNPYWMYIDYAASTATTDVFKFTKPNATMQLYVSTDNGINWIKLWDAIEDAAQFNTTTIADWAKSTGAWNSIQKGLDSYTGKSIKIAFRYVGSDGDSMGIDDINVGQISYITASESLITGLNYKIGSGPSAEKTFVINGVVLNSNITVTPTANIQISKTSGADFVNTPITLTQSAGTVTATIIYVRLIAGLNIADYNTENIAVTSTNAVTKNVVCSGTVLGPNIATSVTSITSLSYNKGSGPSSEQSFTITGALLESDITVTPSANIQISKTSGSGFVNTPLTLIQNVGVVNTTTFYVRLKAGLNFADYNAENIAITSTNAVSKNIACSGTVVGPTITTSTATLSSFSYVRGAGPSTIKTCTISGSLLEANLIVTPSTNYEVSTNGSTFVSTPLTYTPNSGTISSTTLYIRLKAGLSAGAYSENITLESTGAVTKTIACSGNVLGPNVTLSTNTVSGLNYAFDNGPSDQQSFTVSGADLTANVIITPNANLQISTVSGGSFVSTPITLTQSTGIVGTTTIYVRLKAGLVAANYNGNITVSSTNADTKTIAFSGTVDNGTGLTFTVTVPASTKACYINGTMNGATFQAMNKVDATHYSITMPSSTLTDTYKYYSGPNASYIELNAVGATIASRSYSANDVVATWASIYDTTTYYNITVQIGANGNVKENNVVINNGGTVAVASGATKTFTFTPTAGYEVATLTYGGVDVKSQITSNQYTTASVLAAGTLSVTFQKVVYNLAIKSAENGVVNQLCTYGDTPSFSFTPSVSWKINTVFYNSLDVTSSLINGVYIVPAITANALLNVSFVSTITGAPQLINDNLKVYTTQSEIVVEGSLDGENITLFTVNGKQLQTMKSDGERMVIPAQRDAVYLVKTANKTYKVIL